jgi:hypothetical protein
VISLQLQTTSHTGVVGQMAFCQQSSGQLTVAVHCQQGILAVRLCIQIGLVSCLLVFCVCYISRAALCPVRGWGTAYQGNMLPALDTKNFVHNVSGTP